MEKEIKVIRPAVISHETIQFHTEDTLIGSKPSGHKD
jgi:hypothetical protein